MTKTRQPFELKVFPVGNADLGVELSQAANGDSDHAVVRTWGPRLQAVSDHVFEALKAAGYRPADLRRNRQKPFDLPEAVGVRLGLLLLATKPLRKIRRIEDISTAVRGDERGRGVLLVRQMHRHPPRPSGPASVPRSAERPMTRPRVLIEEWLPIREIGVESRRERGASSALPPLYFLHVWWARRPLMASRAAVLGSLLPAWSKGWPDDLLDRFPTDRAYREWFVHLLGVRGDPVAASERIRLANERGVKLDKAYDGPRDSRLASSGGCIRLVGRAGLFARLRRPDGEAGLGSGHGGCRLRSGWSCSVAWPLGNASRRSLLRWGVRPSRCSACWRGRVGSR